MSVVGKLAESDKTAIRPFHVNGPEAALADLHRRLAETRLPEQETVGDYSQGVFLGGLIDMAIVDPLTGAMWTLSRREINLTLQGKTSELADNLRTLSIVLLEDVPGQLLNKLTRVK